jgi:hypothetical protein
MHYVCIDICVYIYKYIYICMDKSDGEPCVPDLPHDGHSNDSHESSVYVYVWIYIYVCIYILYICIYDYLFI